MAIITAMEIAGYGNNNFYGQSGLWQKSLQYTERVMEIITAMDRAGYGNNNYNTQRGLWQ